MELLACDTHVEPTISTIVSKWNMDQMYAFYFVYCNHTTIWDDMEQEIQTTFAQSGESMGIAATAEPKGKSLVFPAGMAIRRSLSNSNIKR